MKKLWCDLRDDAERSDYILSGQAYEAGVIAHVIQSDVAMAFHRCSEYDVEVRRLREENERLRLENLALKADSERINWLADVNNTIGSVVLPREIVEANMASLRQAIDAARGAK